LSAKGVLDKNVSITRKITLFIPPPLLKNHTNTRLTFNSSDLLIFRNIKLVVSISSNTHPPLIYGPGYCKVVLTSKMIIVAGVLIDKFIQKLSEYFD